MSKKRVVYKRKSNNNNNNNKNLTPTGRRSKRANAFIDAIKAKSTVMSNKLFASMFVYAAEQLIDTGNDSYMSFIRQLREPPVSIEEFLDSDKFIGATDLQIWPEVRKAIIDINKDWWKGPKQAYSEAILCGATGTGKSEIMKITLAYCLHILGCMKVPQRYWGLPATTSIVITIMGAKPHVVKKVLYMPLRKYVETMPWFKEHLRPNKFIESEMYFDKLNIRVVTGGSDTDSLLGEAVIASATDEINFINVVQKSKRAGLGTGRSAQYDPAYEIHNSTMRRRKGRFLSNGPQVGVVFASSSARYENDFTSKRVTEIHKQKITTSYVYNKAQFEAKPAENYCGEKFNVLITKGKSGVRILEPNEEVLDGRVVSVPIEYKEDFISDPNGSTRDVLGMAVKSINPFMRQQHKIWACIEEGKKIGLESFLVKDNVLVGDDGMPIVKNGIFCTSPYKPRYVHIDLANTQDRCGIAMVRFDGMQYVQRRGSSIPENLPVASVEMALTLEPQPGHEIDLLEVRLWVANLIKRYGYPIKAVSYDGWQSLESRQAWKKSGMPTTSISVDKGSSMYRQFRLAIYDGRLRMFYQPVLVEELIALEYDEDKDKVDHPLNGGKDCSDAVCGAHNLMMNRPSSWTLPVGYSDRASFNERYSNERRL